MESPSHTYIYGGSASGPPQQNPSPPQYIMETSSHLQSQKFIFKGLSLNKKPSPAVADLDSARREREERERHGPNILVFLEGAPMENRKQSPRAARGSFSPAQLTIPLQVPAPPQLAVQPRTSPSPFLNLGCHSSSEGNEYLTCRSLRNG